MNLSSRQLAVGGGLLACTWLIACGGPEEFRSARDGGLTGVGGSVATGSGGGPIPGSGGADTGGAPATGGRGTGGALATGGRGTGGGNGGGAMATGGRSGGVTGSGGRGTAGADTGSGGRTLGTGGRGTAGRGSGGAASGGRAAGGSGSGGRAAGGVSGNGGVSGTGPCAGLCSNPVTIPKGMNSGGLGTGATCHQVTSMVQGIVCGNFTAPRTFSVNDNVVNCTGNIAPPALRNGGYCMQSTAGQTPSAYFTTY